MNKKLKSWLADDALFYAILIILVAIASFGLGRYSVNQTPSLPISGQSQPAVSLVTTDSESELPENNPSITVVASKSGSKYHLPTCSGAQRIKEENKIYFDSVDLAKAAGYTPAANCPGL